MIAPSLSHFLSLTPPPPPPPHTPACHALSCSSNIYTRRDGHLDFIRLLVAHRADVNLKTNRCNSALHFAFEREWPHIVEFLVQEGGDLDMKNALGKRPADLRPIVAVPTPPPTPERKIVDTGEMNREARIKACLSQISEMVAGNGNEKGNETHLLGAAGSNISESLGENLGNHAFDLLSTCDIETKAAMLYAKTKIILDKR